MLNIIVSPDNVSAEAVSNAKVIVRYLKSEGKEFSVYFSNSDADMVTNLKEIIASGETDLVIIGNDRILNLIVNNIEDLSKVKIGIIPVGIEDDFANYVGISQNPIEAIKEVLSGETQNVDLIKVNDSLALNTVVIGASVEGYEKFKQYKIQNVATKKLAMLKYGSKFEGVELIIDGKAKDKPINVFDFVVANGGESKGRKVSPLSNVSDGYFNVLYALINSDKGKLKFLKDVALGKHIYSENVKQAWKTEINILGNKKDVKAMIDGVVASYESLNISIVEGALKLFKINK